MAVEIYWGDRPGVPSEIGFLGQLEADLNQRGLPAIVLANFFTPRRARQIDFFVTTDTHACHIELKGYNEPLIGQVNGAWSTQRRDGSVEIIDRQNPYTQALECKFSLSDTIRALAKESKGIPSPPSGQFYRHFDSVVCVFPHLAAGSEVPNNYKVRTLGYAEFIDFLAGPGACLPWDRSHWMMLIRSLALTRAWIGAAAAAQDARAVISDYSRNLNAFYSPRLHEHIPLPFAAGDPSAAAPPVTATGLLGLLKDARHIQLVGPSGCGKSHLAKHATLASAAAGQLAIFVDAGLYEGRLSALLDRCIGRHTSYSAQDVLRAAETIGDPTVVMIDGFNECPHPSQERLLGDLSAFCLRRPVQTVITSQSDIPAPEILRGVTLRAGPLDPGHRVTVLASYGTPEILDDCEPFTTAYELSIAAQCTNELRGITSQATLFDAFIRQCLNTSRSPAHLRDVLRHLSMVMNEGLVTWLRVEEVWRIAERVVRARSAPLTVIDEALGSSLTIIQDGRFSFSHELLGRFLLAESILLNHTSSAQIVDELRRPRHRDIPKLVIPLETDPDRVKHVLDGLADSRLFSEAMLGHLGQSAERTVRAAAEDLLARVTAGLASTVFNVPNPYQLNVTGGHELLKSEQALIAAVGIMVFHGELVDAAVTLLDATDAATRRSASTDISGPGPTSTEIVSAVLAGPYNPTVTAPAARILLDAHRHAYIDSRFGGREPAAGTTDQTIAHVLTNTCPDSYGRLLLVCSMLDSTRSIETGIHLPAVLKLCWESRAYHVRFAGLQTAELFAQTLHEHPLHEQIVETLDTFVTANLDSGTSTILVDALHAYDMIESPARTEEIQAEIEDLLQGEWTTERCEVAYHVVSSQFEGVVSDAYSTAVDSLDYKRRTTLYTMASIGSSPHGFWNAWLLQSLADTHDSRTLPAFDRWTTKLNLENSFIQNVGTCYACAMQGIAQFVDTPPQLISCRTADEEAWQCLGAILFWMSKPELDISHLTTLCAPHWHRLGTDLAPATADAVYWLAQPEVVSGAEHRPILSRMIEIFPDHLRSIFEWSLLHIESLTSVFGYGGRGTQINRPNRTAHEIISVLGLVGDENTIRLLQPYVDNQDLGASAIQAIRSLTSDN